jgi:UDP-N-acetylmuramate dehydrogenase
VVVRLPKSFARVTVEPGNRVRAGGGAMGITVASKARDAGIAGLEFLRGIPGTSGGAVRMNAGAYGRECADILVEATLVLRDGRVETWPAERLGYTYRHSDVPAGAVVVEVLFAGSPGDPRAIGAKWTASPKSARRASRCARAPAAPPSRTRPATRPGG